eukprot:gene1529-biopygen13347
MDSGGRASFPRLLLVRHHVPLAGARGGAQAELQRRGDIACAAPAIYRSARERVRDVRERAPVAPRGRGVGGGGPGLPAQVAPPVAPVQEPPRVPGAPTDHGDGGGRGASAEQHRDPPWRM